MERYTLEYKEPYIIKTELLKNRTHQSYRWKPVAVSEDLDALKGYKKECERINKLVDYRIVDFYLNIVE